jgi:hypothetical protein
MPSSISLDLTVGPRALVVLEQYGSKTWPGLIQRPGCFSMPGACLALCDHLKQKFISARTTECLPLWQLQERVWCLPLGEVVICSWLVAWLAPGCAKPVQPSGPSIHPSLFLAASCSMRRPDPSLHLPCLTNIIPHGHHQRTRSLGRQCPPRTIIIN